MIRSKSDPKPNPEPLSQLQLNLYNRRVAVLKYHETLNVQLKEALKAIAKESEGKTQQQLQHLQGDAKQKLANLRLNVKRIEDRIQYASYWAVRVYDRGPYPRRRPTHARPRDELRSLTGHASTFQRR